MHRIKLIGSKSMDPYKTPESDLVASEEMPKEIRYAYYCIGISFLIFFLEELIYAAYTDTGMLDLYNYIFIPIWAGILYWITQSIRSRGKNPKSTFLILALVVSGMAFYDPISHYSIYMTFIESACFLLVYYFLDRPPSKAWFS